MDCKYSPGAKPPQFEEASTATRSNRFRGIVQMVRGIKWVKQKAYANDWLWTSACRALELFSLEGAENIDST